ncbi:hypothetical protein BBO_04263 [Beauveria brongniartii RCEF 3172]|uniref:Uncharacterized protein n=1 Tax=Beauveria brongniartii RCEF 3172 TaxID=1081107 RepID=A0A167EGU3_9HYPO|nr:hypothetical protein BBO_04263 [Beauveria brongniartii RCEF 3172]
MSEPAQQTTTLPLHTTRESGGRRGTQQEKAKARASSSSSSSSGAASSAQQKTTSWTPNFERRQSWNAQDRKHELQMAALDGIRMGPGFTERSS